MSTKSVPKSFGRLKSSVPETWMSSLKHEAKEIAAKEEILKKLVAEKEKSIQSSSNASDDAFDYFTGNKQ